MADDEIKIIRRVRHEISAEFGHDVDRVVDYYRKVEEELKRSGRFRFAASAARSESRQHRDYASNAALQVMLFSERLEVWNPGELPPPLTFESLHVPHPSIPRNPLLAEPLFLTRYIERAGTGTLDMAQLCAEAGLPQPEFRESAGQFIQILWRPKPTGTPKGRKASGTGVAARVTDPVTDSVDRPSRPSVTRAGRA